MNGIERFYRTLYPELPQPNSLGEVNIRGVCHDDNHESVSVNLQTGLWYCHACDIGGDEIDYFRLYLTEVEGEDGENLRYPDLVGRMKAMGWKKEDNEEVQRRVQKQRRVSEEVEPIPETKVNRWHDMLLNTNIPLRFLQDERGFSTQTIKDRKIGWDTERITIPIYDDRGNVVNVRRYDKDAQGSRKMLSYAAGYGSARLYPIENMARGEILLCEGEMDCLIAEQMGYNAVTVTGGAGTWSDAWNPMFTGKAVNIVYDVDKVGKRGAEKVAQKLLNYASQIKIIDLPIMDPPNADITDYFVKLGHTKEDLDRVIEETDVYKGDKVKSVEDNGPTHKVHLSEASDSKYYFKNIEMDVVVAGKDLAPYIVPKEVKITCPADKKNCMSCGLGLSGGAKTVEIGSRDRVILKLLDCTDTQQKMVLKELAGVVGNCGAAKITEVSAQNVEEVVLMPELDFNTKDAEYVLRRAYIVPDDRKINSNHSYTVQGTTVPDPWSQYATHLLDRTEPAQDSISSFKMTPELKSQLEIFQPDNGDVIGKFKDISADLSRNVTHIYGRDDIIMGVDLVYHSVLGFSFVGSPVDRGWVETLILGDTRTGKTYTVNALMEHYQLGEFVTGENSSFAGLVGGMQQTNNRWSITWGKIPLNDRRLVAVDEMSGLSLDEIGIMSGVRSSGIAEITKIQTERTYARTRLLWISNDRAGTGLSEYSFGVDALKELIGKNEDIARFDFVVTASSDEVDIECINKYSRENSDVPHKYTSELCKQLILWAWSREPYQIEFEDEAIDAIYRHATEMGEIYVPDIPLVEAANQRIKLARLSVAAAARMFSCDETGEKIIVKEEHVEFIRWFLEGLYSKDSLGYKDYSMQIREREAKANKAKQDVKKLLDKQPELGDLIMLNDALAISDLEAILDIERQDARRYITFLMRNGMVSKASHGYKKTPSFITTLREWKAERRNKND